MLPVEAALESQYLYQAHNKPFTLYTSVLSLQQYLTRVEYVYYKISLLHITARRSVIKKQDHFQRLLQTFLLQHFHFCLCNTLVITVGCQKT